MTGIPQSTTRSFTTTTRISFPLTPRRILASKPGPTTSNPQSVTGVGKQTETNAAGQGVPGNEVVKL
jgi:hypothetical protein